MPVDSSTTDTFIDSIPEPTSVSGINGALPAVFAAPSSLFLTFVSGWFLISFVKELRMLVHEVGDAVENGLGDLDGGKSRRMGKGHDLEDTDSFMNPASPVIEGLIARLCPPAKPAVEAWTGMPPKPEGGPCQIQTFQDSYQKKSQSFRRRKKTKDVKPPPLPPSVSEKVVATYRSLLSRLSNAELQMLSQILHTPPPVPPKIGGMSQIKKTLLSTLLPKPTKYKSALLKPPTGLLLYGPPGNGKTLLCSFVSHFCFENSRPFLTIRPGTFYSKFVGDTSNNVGCFFGVVKKLNYFNALYYNMWKEEFNKVGSTERTVVFVDEVDGLFRSRGAGGGGSGEGSEVYRDFKTEFMQYWDGVEGDGGVIIIGASNRPYDIDEAFLRRMPRSYQIGLPSYKTRLRILESLTSDFPTNVHALRPLARNTEGFSASDLKEVCKVAVTNWVEMGEPDGEVGGKSFAEALASFTPSSVTSREYGRDVREYEGAVGGGGAQGGKRFGDFINDINGFFGGVGGGDGMFGGQGEGSGEMGEEEGMDYEMSNEEDIDDEDAAADDESSEGLDEFDDEDGTEDN